MNLQKSQFLLLLAATSVLAAGCGSGGGSSAGSGSPAAGTSIAKARAVAYADAINLDGADVPGATIVKSEGEAKAPTPAGVELARCAGRVSAERRIIDIHSPTFRSASAREGQRVKSSVEVMPSAALAARNNAAARSARGRSCIARFLARALSEQSTGPLRHGPISISSLPNSLPGADGNFGLRLATTVMGRNLRGGKIRTRVYTDEFGFVSGPAEINLTATGVSRPVPSTTEQHLLSLLFSRAQEHKL